jgi:hypothetical protein
MTKVKMPLAAAMLATWETPATLLLHELGSPSVARAMAVRRPVMVSRAFAYWTAPCSAGIVGVPPSGSVPLMAAMKAGATPGSAAMGTGGLA